jgi:predicted RNA-binding Zn-ribbon protein involved in translation (DUF1610 family)
MPKLVCVKCEVELKPEKNGVHVHELFQKNTAIYKVWEADLWKCPGCGFLIVAGFANVPTAEHYEKDRLQSILKDEKKHHITIINDKEFYQ